MPAADKTMLHIHAMVAEMERDFISLRTKAALAAERRAAQARRRQGRPVASLRGTRPRW